MSRIRLSALALTVALLPLTSYAETAKSASAPVTHAEFEALLKETLTKNPDIIVQAIAAARAQQEVKDQENSKTMLEQHKAEIFADKTSPFAGNPKGDVTIVEFFDYHCGYCKQMVPAITKLLDEDKNVRVIFRDFPILSQDSTMAARAALAVAQIDGKKYFPYYTALMKINGKFDEAALLQAAADIGLKPEAVKKGMSDPIIDKMLERNRKLAQDLGIHGTPAMLVGDHFLPGAMPYEDLKKLVDETRSAKKQKSS